MKKFFFLIIVSLTFACNSNENTKQQTQPKTTEVEDYVLRYEKSGALKITGTLKNGRREGIWTAWHENGEVESEVKYIDDLRHGPIRTWYDNGKLRYKGFYSNGEPIGEWIYYSREGEELKRVKK